METITTKTFWFRQLNQIKDEGWSAVRRKLWMMLGLLLTISLVLITIPLVLIVRLLRPLVLIRFGKLISERIGHFAGNTEMYMCECDEAKNGNRPFDLFGCGSFVSNRQLLKMWKRQLRVYPFVRYLIMANKILPGGDIHEVKIPQFRFKEKNRAAGFGTHLNFTNQEELLGKQYLNNVGLNNDDKFVCLYVRDSRYLDEVYSCRSHDEWKYHDYRDADINKFVSAAEYLAKNLGYYVFRMGYLVKNKINTDHPRIIDYATNGDRSEFLDIYLSAKCHFFIASGGGITAVAVLFGRPVAAVNDIPLEYIHASPIDIFIPKKLYSKEKRRFLTFKEIMASGAGRFLKLNDYERAGLEVIENTPEEIIDLVIEMHERLNGTWCATEEDEELQQRFRTIFHDSIGKPINPIGAEFLRQNRELLD